jgi:hypothetical protein
VQQRLSLSAIHQQLNHTCRARYSTTTHTNGKLVYIRPRTRALPSADATTHVSSRPSPYRLIVSPLPQPAADWQPGDAWGHVGERDDRRRAAAPPPSTAARWSGGCCSCWYCGAGIYVLEGCRIQDPLPPTYHFPSVGVDLGERLLLLRVCWSFSPAGRQTSQAARGT